MKKITYRYKLCRMACSVTNEEKMETQQPDFPKNQKFDVHSYLVVRVKVEGVEAENAESAIKAVEDNSELQARIARLVQMKRQGEEISAIELDEGAMAVGYLVDVVGDEDYENSRSFDVSPKGKLLEHGKEPGRNVPISVLQRAALADYADGDLRPVVARSTDQQRLFENLKNDTDDLLPLFVAQELAGLASDQIAEATERLDNAISDLTCARDAVANLPTSLDKLNASCIQTSTTQDIIPVIVDGTEIGTIQRSRAGSGSSRGLWRDAVLVINHTPVARGMDKIVAYIHDSFGRAPEIVIQTHPGYHAIYDHDGTIGARIIADENGYHLRIFDPHYTSTFITLEEALCAAGITVPTAIAYARANP